MYEGKERKLIYKLLNNNIMKKKFICTVCGYIYEGTEAPEKCPVCKAPASKFKEMEDPMDGPAFATVTLLVLHARKMRLLR